MTSEARIQEIQALNDRLSEQIATLCKEAEAELEEIHRRATMTK